MKRKDVAKRLGESKRQSNKERFDSGTKLGREWAEVHATADELELLARGHDFYNDIGEVATKLGHYTDELVGPDIAEDVITAHSDQFAQGFVTGALVVFAEHAEIFGPAAVECVQAALCE